MLSDTSTNVLAAYLYLHLSDAMPAPVLDADGEIDFAADDAALTAWSQSQETLDLDRTHLQPFLVQTELLLIDLEQLELDPAEPAGPQYMTLFYDAAKGTFDGDKTRLRTYFLWLYLVLFQKPDGPRWGDFVEIYGRTEFIEFARRRFAELI